MKPLLFILLVLVLPFGSGMTCTAYAQVPTHASKDDVCGRYSNANEILVLEANNQVRRWRDTLPGERETFYGKWEKNGDTITIRIQGYSTKGTNLPTHTLNNNMSQKFIFIHNCLCLIGNRNHHFCQALLKNPHVYVYNNQKDTLYLSKNNGGGLCFYNTSKVIDSIQIDGTGAKEIVFFRTFQCRINEHGGTFDIEENIKSSDYEIWNLDTKKLIFKAENYFYSDYQRSGAYLHPPNATGVETYSYDFNIDSAGKIVISNIKREVNAHTYRSEIVKKNGKEETITEKVPYNFGATPDKMEGTYEYINGEYIHSAKESAQTEKDSLVLNKKTYLKTDTLEVSFKCSKGYGVIYYEGLMYKTEKLVDGLWIDNTPTAYPQNSTMEMHDYYYEENGRYRIPVSFLPPGTHRLVLYKRNRNPAPAKKMLDWRTALINPIIFENNAYWKTETFIVK